MDYLSANTEILLDLCNKGIEGKYRLTVEQVGIPITNKCNNYCIMCHWCSKDYENHTFENETPFCLTLEQLMDFFPMPKKRLFKRNQVYQNEIEFVCSEAESLLNPNCYELFKYLKTIYPNCKIRLISNATIPPSPRDIVKYIDRIGFSIDGSTEEIFEYLRPPAKFKHVLDVLQEWDEAASELNDDFTFGFGTVLSSANIAEFSEIIRLASNFKHIDSVYVQPIVIYESRSHLKHLLLENVNSNELEACISSAKEVSTELGIRVDGLDSIISILENRNKKERENKYNDYNNSRYCRYMWNHIVSLNENGGLRFLCCMMQKEMSRELAKLYSIPGGGYKRGGYL